MVVEWKIIDIVFNMERMPRKVLADGILFVYSVFAKQERLVINIMKLDLSGTSLFRLQGLLKQTG